MKTSLRKPAAALLLILSAACAKSQTEDPQPRTQLSIITREQLEEHHFTNAYEAVQALRGNWLQARGPDSFRRPSQVLVYFDAVKLGEVATLRSLTTWSIGRIEHFDGLAATSRWGVGHSAGVILVSSDAGTPARSVEWR